MKHEIVWHTRSGWTTAGMGSSNEFPTVWAALAGIGDLRALGREWVTHADGTPVRYGVRVIGSNDVAFEYDDV